MINNEGWWSYWNRGGFLHGRLMMEYVYYFCTSGLKLTLKYFLLDIQNLLIFPLLYSSYILSLELILTQSSNLLFYLSIFCMSEDFFFPCWSYRRGREQGLFVRGFWWLIYLHMLREWWEWFLISGQTKPATSEGAQRNSSTQELQTCKMHKKRKWDWVFLPNLNLSSGVRALWFGEKALESWRGVWTTLEWVE